MELFAFIFWTIILISAIVFRFLIRRKELEYKHDIIVVLRDIYTALSGDIYE